MDAGLCGFFFTAGGPKSSLSTHRDRPQPSLPRSEAAYMPFPDLLGNGDRSLVHGDGPKPAPDGGRTAAGGDTISGEPHFSLRRYRAEPRQIAFLGPTSPASTPTSGRSIAPRTPPCAHRPGKKQPCR